VFTYSFEPDTSGKLPDHLSEEVKNERATV
jgi:hypothetical protein